MRSHANTLRSDWWAIADQSHPPVGAGIYEWRIGDRFLYIGKSKRLPRRIREYPNNVRKLLSGKPYRKGKPDQYRNIHIEMGRAHDEHAPVILTILENCDPSALNQRERHWIELRRTQARDGGPEVLNAN